MLQTKFHQNRPDGSWKEVKSMQRSGTEAIRTQLQLLKPKREITNITNSQNTKRTYGQPSEQLFPKRWPILKILKFFTMYGHGSYLGHVTSVMFMYFH